MNNYYNSYCFRTLTVLKRLTNSLNFSYGLLLHFVFNKIPRFKISYWVDILQQLMWFRKLNLLPEWSEMLQDIHCPSKVKVQPVLMLSCFAHYSWINEHKDMKLR